KGEDEALSNVLLPAQYTARRDDRHGLGDILTICSHGNGLAALARDDNRCRRAAKGARANGYARVVTYVVIALLLTLQCSAYKSARRGAARLTQVITDPKV